MKLKMVLLLWNNEVKNGFITMIATSYLKPGERITGWIFDVLDAMRAGNIEKLEPLFTSFLSHFVSFEHSLFHEKKR